MGTTKCDKSTVVYDFGITLCEDDTIKCEKKKRELPNMIKVQLYVMLVLHNVRMIPSNMKKKKGTTKCDKSTVTCDIGTAQCEDCTIKCKK